MEDRRDLEFRRRLLVLAGTLLPLAGVMLMGSGAWVEHDHLNRQEIFIGLAIGVGSVTMGLHWLSFGVEVQAAARERWRRHPWASIPTESQPSSPGERRTRRVGLLFVVMSLLWLTIALRTALFSGGNPA